MKHIEITDFQNLSDACLWLESNLYDLEIGSNGIKGELFLLPDGRWRAAIIEDDFQMELKLGD
jgi:hypothetical protein